MTVRVGDDVKLVCEASSDSPFTLSWEREPGGTSLPAGRTLVNNGKLILRDIKKHDYGVYVCVAKSGDAEAKQSTTLVVICKFNVS